MRRTLFLTVASLAVTAAWAGLDGAELSPTELPAAATRTIDFSRDVQPLLATRCWSCHGARKQESGLRLDRRDLMLTGGDSGPAVTPGKSQESLLIRYVAAIDPDQVMPPEGDRLSREAVGVLRAWIDQGCVWPASSETMGAINTHWAYQPLHRSIPPAVKRRDWPANPIDQFILAELEKRGLAPSREADKYTLIRRLSLDLLGLPPTIEEVDAFVADQRPNAYEELVDRLLSSPHFGERWGRHWLDMARYADSDGYEKDNARPDAYRWRDWVIDAVNADMPFDQFTIEQLAGDLLPHATASQRLATAFHRQTLTNTEGGTDQEQFRVEACFDRTETTGAIWLGLTVGCARCHTHKYDAITQREYYQLFALFNNADETTTVVSKSPDEVAAYEKAKASHDAAVASATARLREAQAALGPTVIAWEEQTRPLFAKRDPVVLHPLSDLKGTADGKVTLKNQPDGSLLATGASPATATYTLTGRATASTVNALRLDVLPDASLPGKGPGRSPRGNFVLSELAMEVSPNADFSASRAVAFGSATADFEQEDRAWLAVHAFDGDPATGWAVSPRFGLPHHVVFHLKEPLPLSDTYFVRFKMTQQYGRQHTLGRFKLSLQSGTDPVPALPADVAKAIVTEPTKRTAAQRQAILDYVSELHSPTKELLAAVNDLKTKAPPKPELSVRVLAQRTENPRKTFLLKRGEFLEPVLDVEVRPGAFATLPPLASRQPGAIADRLDLARWLVDPKNPLTPRVTVNHVWRLLFGNGLVRTPDDFGVRGEAPTHPALLDWLAAEFIGLESTRRHTVAASSAASIDPATPWSRKGLIKRIVMSATYRQASRHRDDLKDQDPQNLLLARQNRVRVEAEIVRDLSLDVAGLLSPKIGGPSVFPPLPPGIAELSYAGNFKWTPSTGADRYRRGLYTFFKRTAPHPNLITFDCPDANLTCIERRTSNTPLQALTSLNNETFAEAARAFARRLLQEDGQNDDARLTRAFRLCLARPPAEQEQQELRALLADARAWYRTHPEAATTFVGAEAAAGVPPAENAAWIATARVLINLDEFITRE